MNLSIRQADFEDLNIVCDFYFEFGRTFGKPHLMAPWNNNKIVKVCLDSVSEPNKVAFLLEDDGVPIGLMMGFMNDFCYSDAWFAQDRMFYIRKGKRSLQGLRMLVDAFTKWAKEGGCYSISLTALGSRDNEALVKILHRWGYITEGYQCTKLL